MQEEKDADSFVLNGMQSGGIKRDLGPAGCKQMCASGCVRRAEQHVPSQVKVSVNANVSWGSPAADGASWEVGC